MKKIFLTFDYEMFMKKSGTPEKCLLEPVNLLIDHLHTLGITATFFIDILYYIRLLEALDTREDATKIKQQLQALISNGHRIELHLHPHWLDAVYQQGEWVFPSLRYYRLQSLPEERVTELFVSGVQALHQIAHEVDKDYKIVAFRAGGWCIMPFGSLQQGFEKGGIVLDSSVARGISLQSATHSADFSEVPFVEQYRFSDDPLQVRDNGTLIEFPISTYCKSPMERIAEKAAFALMDNKRKQIFGDGVGLSSNTLSRFESWRGRFRAHQQMFTLEHTRAEFLSRKVEAYPLDSILFISHPKGLCLESFRCIELLHARGHSFANVADVV
jgi:hypothetical protein